MHDLLWDNGADFTRKTMCFWARDSQIKLRFI